MELFPARLLSDLEGLPGAGHSYLRQLCAPDGAALRGALEQAVARIPEPVQSRSAELLGALDNRKFFQGFAEVASLVALEGAGWRAGALHRPGPRIEIARPGSPTLLLSVLAFLHQTRPGGEDETRRRLLGALSRVASRHRFAVLVRRWLPHDFDPEPVRRAIDLWLAQVQSGQWEGRYAAYEDEHVSLEFCLTGERAAPGASPVALAIGPFFAHRSLAVLEPRVVTELDRHLASAQRASPILLACVADQPWSLNEGYIRDFLYGRARAVRTEGGVMEAEYGASASVSVFRDPLYAGVAGLLLIDRNPALPTSVRVRALLNPWCSTPISAEEVGVRCFAEDADATAVARAAPRFGGEASLEDARSAPRVLRWFDGAGTRVGLE